MTVLHIVIPYTYILTMTNWSEIDINYNSHFANHCLKILDNFPALDSPLGLIMNIISRNNE